MEKVKNILNTIIIIACIVSMLFSTVDNMARVDDLPTQAAQEIVKK